MKKYFSMYKLMLNSMKEYKAKYLLACLIASLEGISGLLEPFIFQTVVNSLETDKNWSRPFIVFAIILILIPIICYSIYYQEKIAVIAKAELSKVLVKKVQSISLNTLIEIKPSNILSVLTRDIGSISRSVKGMAASSILQFCAMMIISLTIIGIIDLRFLVVGILYCIILIYISYYYLKRMMKVNDKIRKVEYEEMVGFTDGIYVSPILRSFNSGGFFIEKLKKIQEIILFILIKEQI